MHFLANSLSCCDPLSVPQKANLLNNEVNKTCYVALWKKITEISTLSNCNEKQSKFFSL